MLAWVLCVAMLIAFSQAEAWRGIKPLQSSREDVERLLGSPTGECKCLYEGPKVNVQVQYSTGPCKTGASPGWNVPAGTVISATVYLKERPLMSDLKVDWEKYKKREDPELPLIFYYSNPEEGITIAVDGNRVMEYQIGPTLKDGNMRCNNPPG